MSGRGEVTFDDALSVWAMHWNGVFQNRIAATFDVNPGRVNEILKGQKYKDSRVAALSKFGRAA